MFRPRAPPCSAPEGGERATDDQAAKKHRTPKGPATGEGHGDSIKKNGGSGRVIPDWG